MFAAEEFEFGLVKALHADGNAVDSCGAEGLEFRGFDGGGVGFERDFASGAESPELVNFGDDALN